LCLSPTFRVLHPRPSFLSVSHSSSLPLTPCFPPLCRLSSSCDAVLQCPHDTAGLGCGGHQLSRAPTEHHSQASRYTRTSHNYYNVTYNIIIRYNNMSITAKHQCTHRHSRPPPHISRNAFSSCTLMPACLP
jgi:hypothetical protein